MIRQIVLKKHCDPCPCESLSQGGDVETMQSAQCAPQNVNHELQTATFKQATNVFLHFALRMAVKHRQRGATRAALAGKASSDSTHYFRLSGAGPQKCYLLFAHFRFLFLQTPNVPIWPNRPHFSTAARPLPQPNATTRPPSSPKDQHIPAYTPLLLSFI